MEKAHKTFLALSFTLFGILLMLCTLTVILAACANTTTISFETFGGSEIAPISARVGEELVFPENPQKEGYVFVGWYLTDTFEEEAVKSSVVPASNTTYYAKFEKYPTLTISSGGQYYIKEGTSLSSVLRDNTPVKDGLVFDYWEIDGKVLEDSACMPKGDLTAVAHFKAAYRVELYLQTAAAWDQFEAVEGESGFVSEGENITVEIPSFEHYVLDESVSSKPNRLADESCVFSFYYRLEPVTLTFYHGEEAETVQSYYGATVSLSARFSQEGYSFYGWAKENGGKAEYAAEDTLTLGDEDVALYAAWAKQYRDGRGGEEILSVAEYEENGVQEIWLGSLSGTCTGDALAFSDGGTGRIENGYYLLSDSGTYREYLLSPSGDTGSITLDFETGEAVYSLEEETLVGSYRYLYDQTEQAYTGRYSFECGQQSFLFLLSESGFLREGQEKGEYCLYNCFAGEYNGSVLLELDGLGVARYTSDGATYTASYRGCGEGEWILTTGSGSTRLLTYEYKSYLGGTVLESVPVFLEYRADWTGKFVGKSGDYILLDGYGFRGEYSVGGATYVGVFCVEDDVVSFSYVIGTDKKIVKFKLERIAGSFAIL